MACTGFKAHSCKMIRVLIVGCRDMLSVLQCNVQDDKYVKRQCVRCGEYCAGITARSDTLSGITRAE